MKRISSFGKGAAVVGALLGMSALFPATAFADSTAQAAIKLDSALRALPLNHVSYLYAYLQSVQFTNSEISQINSNAKQVQHLFAGKTNATQLTAAEKVEAVRLFLQSAELAHLKVAFVNANGSAIDIAQYRFNTPLYVQLKDEKGKLLATLEPVAGDATPRAIAGYVHDVFIAAKAAQQLGETGRFVPIPQGKLPVTANNDPTKILLGSILILLGGLSLVPMTKAIRRKTRAEA